MILSLRILGGILAGLVLSFNPICAQDRPAELIQVENYFNKLRTLTGFFVQMNPNGAISEGKFYISKPGRMRFDYSRPRGQLIVADGQNIIFHDLTHEETGVMPLVSSPISFLVREKLRFGYGTDIDVQDISHSRGRLHVTLSQRQDPDSGTLTLVFTQKPFELCQWIVVDAQKLETVVNLEEVKQDVLLDEALFVFKPLP